MLGSPTFREFFKDYMAQDPSGGSWELKYKDINDTYGAINHTKREAYTISGTDVRLFAGDYSRRRFSDQRLTLVKSANYSFIEGVCPVNEEFFRLTVEHIPQLLTRDLFHTVDTNYARFNKKLLYAFLKWRLEKGI